MSSHTPTTFVNAIFSFLLLNIHIFGFADAAAVGMAARPRSETVQRQLPRGHFIPATSPLESPGALFARQDTQACGAGSCAAGEVCCNGGQGCCPNGYTCSTVLDVQGSVQCCPAGVDCTSLSPSADGSSTATATATSAAAVSGTSTSTSTSTASPSASAAASTEEIPVAGENVNTPAKATGTTTGDDRERAIMIGASIGGGIGGVAAFFLAVWAWRRRGRWMPAGGWTKLGSASAAAGAGGARAGAGGGGEKPSRPAAGAGGRGGGKGGGGGGVPAPPAAAYTRPYTTYFGPGGQI